MSAEPVEATVIEEPGSELAPVAPRSLWRTDDPAEVLTRATDTAEALMPVIRARGLVVSIQGRDHLTVEAWQTLGAMVGVSPVCVWTRKLEDGWEARVEARASDGRVVGAAEAECLRGEDRWSRADDFAVRSMAQTRATSKALASVLRFVATLGGAAGTPAEEMPREGHGRGGRPDRPASEKQRKWVQGGGGRPSLFDKASLGEGQRAALVRWLSGGDELTSGAASRLIEALKDDPDAGARSLFEAMHSAASDGNPDAQAATALLTSDVPADVADLAEKPSDEDLPF